MISCVLFDLDGTLLDTAPDLVGALNRLRAEHGLAPLPYAGLRAVASHGSAAMVRAGFGIADDAPGFAALVARFVALYRDGLAEATAPLPGIEAVLAALEARGLRWGVVTNKPAALTGPLMAALGLAARAACIVSGDTLPTRKPDPAPMLHACALAGVSPAECLYIGDAERDVEAGRRAGMVTLAARFGYLGADDRPEAWGADGIVDAPEDILAWVAGR